MMGLRTPAIRAQAWVSFALLLLGVLAAWQIGGWIAAEDTRALILTAMAVVLCLVAFVILRNWRAGLYVFLVWMLAEDLVRKFLGNNMAVYFGKDVLAALIYISLLASIRRGKEPVIRPSFLIYLSLFFWLGFLQVFNPYSPSILYGLLGMKLFFYYVPLFFAGYALAGADAEIRRFLQLNLGLAGVISLLGIIQAIVGPQFLNPPVLAPEIRGMAELQKVAPISGRILTLPSSVFVSSGRFGWYLILMWVLGLGTAGYLLLGSRRGRKFVFGVLGVVAVAILLSGSRGALLFSSASGLVLVAFFLWGAPWQWGEAHRLLQAIRRALLIVSLALAGVVFFFPGAVGARWDFYSETLSPESPAYQLAYRTWDYPIGEFLKAFEKPNWQAGNGIGTVSLGTQYVSRLLRERAPAIGVESGYGTLIVEMGLLGLALWLVWTIALLLNAWKVVRRLRHTRFFPLGFAIFWVVFLVLFPMTYGGLAAYQNFVLNAYLWLLLGILFRLPKLEDPMPIVAVAGSTVLHPRWSNG